MGEIIHGREGAAKPVQLVPMIGLPKDSFAERGKTYLGEITLFINGSCDKDCDVCNIAYKQVPCCVRPPSNPLELDLEEIKKILEETDTGPLTRININGGNILRYKRLPELIDLLQKSCAGKTLTIHYLNLAGSVAGFNLPKHSSFILNIPVTFPVKREKLKNTLSQLEKNNFNYKLAFILRGAKELVQAQDIVKGSRVERYSFYPCYNGGNTGFFKKYVYVKKKNLLNSKPSIKDILARKVVNHNYFGHLIIQNNGNVYASINDKKPLGNISGDSIGQLVCREMQRKNRWLKTRDKVKPCRDCHYRLLCPSISNYEYAIGKNNLCTLFKENKHETDRH